MLVVSSGECEEEKAYRPRAGMVSPLSSRRLATSLKVGAVGKIGIATRGARRLQR
jgi:hypothetical protein